MTWSLNVNVKRVELSINHKPILMKTKKHFPSVIGIVLILSFALSSCSTSKKSAVACPEFPNSRYGKVATDHKQNRNKPLTAHSYSGKRSQHVTSSVKNHKDNNLTFSNQSETGILRVPAEERVSHINKIDYSQSLTASADNRIIPAGRLSSATYMINLPDQAETQGNIFIPQQAGCDTLVLRSGSVLLGKVEEIGQSEIKYRKCDNLNGPFISLAKSEVVQIKFMNGTREVITSDNPGTIPVYAGRPAQDNVPPRTEGLAVAGFIASIVGLFIAGIPLGTLAVIFGMLSLSKIKRYPARYRGRGLAIASIILGFVCIVGAIIAISMM